MGEKLIIKNFGPIKSVELDLGSFNVLIGEQATGKSTVAKVLAVCRYFSYIIEEEEPYTPPFHAGLSAWGLNEAIRFDSYIFYECGHYSLTGEVEIESTYEPDSEIEQKYFFFYCKLKPLSIEFKNLLNELNKITPVKDEDSSFYFRTIPITFYQNEVSKVMDNPFYLPTERGLQSIFSLGKNSIQNISDSLFNQFARTDQITRIFKKETSIEPLNITYKNVDGKGFVRKNNETHFYSLYNAASGYQSTIPVVLVTKYYRDVKKKKKTFIIEEPELNLFPSAQQKLVDYLVGNVINTGSSILINTHSPYILSSINDLLYAFKVGQTNESAVNEIIPTKQWLDPSLFRAYRLLPNGTAKNIVDADLDEILVEELDGAGKDINALYDKILDIKFSSNEKPKRLSSTLQ